jgi:lipoprotein-releasing system permease protein
MGVTVLIVVIAVMNGFEREFLGKMLGAYGHLRLLPVGDGRILGTLEGYQEWIPRLRKIKGVSGISPVIESGVTIVAELEGFSEPRAQFIQVRGIDPLEEEAASDLISSKLIGDWATLMNRESMGAEAAQPQSSTTEENLLIDPFAIKAETPGIFLGLELARDLFRVPNLWQWTTTDSRFKTFALTNILGKKIKLIVPRIDRGPSGMEFFFVEVQIEGLFKTGFFDFDLRSALVSLDTARLFKKIPPGAVEFLEVCLDNPDPANTQRVAKAMIDVASNEYHSNFYPFPWMAINPVLLKAVEIEKVVMGSILTLVVLVAAFGIASTLVMTVLEKTREIGTLMALGTRRRSIMSIFILNGFQVGVWGTLLGVLLGLVLCGLVAVLQIPLPGGGGVYVLDVLPVEVRWLDVTIIALFSMLASTLAGIYPAWKAARLQPVEALSYE